MLKNVMIQGMEVTFADMKCQVLEVPGESRIRLSMPEVGGQIRVLPLYTQGELFFETSRGRFRTRGEILERYKSQNRYVMEVELKDGLYRADTEEEPILFCNEEVLLSFDNVHMEVIITAITAKELTFCVEEGTLSEERSLPEETMGELTFRQMRLAGKVADVEKINNRDVYHFIFEGVPVETRKKLTEFILLGGNTL